MDSLEKINTFECMLQHLFTQISVHFVLSVKSGILRLVEKKKKIEKLILFHIKYLVSYVMGPIGEIEIEGFGWFLSSSSHFWIGDDCVS